MTKHYDGRIHWNRVMKLLRANGNSLALYDLAHVMGLPVDDVELHKAVSQLQRQGRIRISLGRSKHTKMVCRIAYIVEPEESLRDRVAASDPVEESTIAEIHSEAPVFKTDVDGKD